MVDNKKKTSIKNTIKYRNETETINTHKTSISEMIRKPPLVKAQTALNKNKKYGEKRFSIWRMEFLHPAMWQDHDLDFAR